MKAVIHLLGWVLATPLAWGLERVVPEPLGVERYAQMGRQCPFAVASPTVPPVAAQASFAANWYVGGIARLGDADFVTIKARDLSAQFSLYGQEPDSQSQVTLVSVEWVEGVGKSLVTIRKGAETAKLEFNEAEVRGPGQPTAAVQMANGKPPVTGATPAPLAMGARPIPVSGVNGAAQRLLKTVVPPTNQGAALPHGTPPSVRAPLQAPNGVPRSLPPGPRRTVYPANQAPR